VVPPEQLDAAVQTLAGLICDKSPSAMRLGLEALAAQLDAPLSESLADLRARLAACLATDDAREGLTAFLQKRKPVWTGR